MDNNSYNDHNDYACKPYPPCETQTHVHEIQDSVKLAEKGDERHNHHFATVSSEVIPIMHHKHKHTFFVNTDYFDHHHEVTGETGPNIEVGGGKHVHFAKGRTTLDDGHCHEYQFATLIENPLI